MGQSKSQPGLVKIPRTQVIAVNNASMHGSTAANNQSNQSNSRQAVESNNAARRQQQIEITNANVVGKHPAKQLNATINLEQMLNSSKSNRVLPNP